MKNNTNRAISAASCMGALVLLVAVVDADTVRYGDVNGLETDMEQAAIIALGTAAGEIIEAELERDDGKSVWEIEIVGESRQVIEIEIDSQTGEVLRTETDDDEYSYGDYSVSLAKAIDIARSVEKGALIEAELELESGELVWEIEAVNSRDEELEFRINATTGEII